MKHQRSRRICRQNIIQLSSISSLFQTSRFDVTWFAREPDATACRAVASRLHFRFNAAPDPWINISSRLRFAAFLSSLLPFALSLFLSVCLFLSSTQLSRFVFHRLLDSPLCSRSSHLLSSASLTVNPSHAIYHPRRKYRYLQLTPGTLGLFALALLFLRSINDVVVSPPPLSRFVPILMHRDIARCNTTKPSRTLCSSPRPWQFDASFEISMILSLNLNCFLSQMKIFSI